jgi:hypothetical protein
MRKNVPRYGLPQFGTSYRRVRISISWAGDSLAWDARYAKETWRNGGLSRVLMEAFLPLAQVRRSSLLVCIWERCIVQRVGIDGVPTLLRYADDAFGRPYTVSVIQKLTDVKSPMDSKISSHNSHTDAPWKRIWCAYHPLPLVGHRPHE